MDKDNKALLIYRANMANNHGSTQAAKYKTNYFYGYIVVIASCIIMIVTFGSYYSFGIFFKPILAEFGWTRGMTASAFSLATVLLGIVGIPVGILNDRYGPRIVTTCGGFLLGLGYLLMSRTNSLWQLYLFYGITVGIGMGGLYVPPFSTVARWFVKRRGLMTGIVMAGIGMGTLVTPPLANWLILNYEWQQAYLFLGTGVLVLILPATQFLKRDPTKTGQKPYCEEEIEGFRSRKKVSAITFKKAIHASQLWIVGTMLFSYGFCIFSIIVHIAPHATDLGISSAKAASILAVIGGTSIIGKVVMGYTVDRIGSKRVWIICFIIMAIALFCLGTAQELWILYAISIIFGFAYGAGASAQSPLIADLFGLGSHGVILGFGSFFFTIGASIGPLITGYVFDIFSIYKWAFLICGTIAILGCGLAIFLKPNIIK